jgi:hypothetical protein
MLFVPISHMNKDFGALSYVVGLVILFDNLRLVFGVLFFHSIFLGRCQEIRNYFLYRQCCCHSKVLKVI